jgi:hypothetical protein
MPAPDDHAHTSRIAGLVGGPITLARREAARMPLLALTTALQAWQRTSGVRSFALRRGNEALQIVAHTPLGRFLPQPVHDDDADAEAARIATAARTGTSAPTRPTPAKVAPAKATPTERVPVKPVPATDATEAKAAAPAASTPAPEAVAAGAPGVVTDQVEKITEKLHVEEPQSREELPIPDFDNVSLGSLRARLRSLSVEDLVKLREWEQAHAHRLPVITLLDNRIAKVSADSATSGSGTYPKSGEQAAKTAQNAASDEGGTLRV